MNEKELMPAAEKNEIIVYQPEGGEFHIEVRVENETVWLTQAQMAELFGTSRTNIVEHIGHIYEENELDLESTCRKFRQVQIEGSRRVNRQIPFYNLDMILSLGYRGKSAVATKFRRWANQVLKEHLLRGCSVNQRLVSHENRLENLDSRVIYLEKQVDFFVKANLSPSVCCLRIRSGAVTSLPCSWCGPQKRNSLSLIRMPTTWCYPLWQSAPKG